MSRLLVDIGNSTVARAWMDKGLEMLGTLSKGAGLLDNLPGSPGEVWVASVADAARTASLLDPLREAGIPVVEVRVPDHARLLETRYHPAQLGVDRWLGLLACRARGWYPAVVVDAGTATTIDLLDSEGVHQGGYILPGLDMMRSALLAGTAIRLREAPIDCAGDALPVGTADAIHCGAIQAQVALIERLFVCLAAGGRVVLGGGMAPKITSHLRCRWEMMEHMVLQGLAVLAERGETCAG